MNKYFGFLLSLFVLLTVLNCSWIQEKVEQKVNQKIDQKIDESMKKLDSSLSREKLDSLQMLMDSISTKNEKRKN
jgi:sensor domain CHASE-containing protein